MFILSIMSFSDSNMINIDWKMNNFFSFLKTSSAFSVYMNDIFFLVKFVSDKMILKYFFIKCL